MVAREAANEKAGENAVKGICTLISDANSDIQGKISCISKRQDNLDLANKTMNEKLDQISEKVNETKPLLLSIQNQLLQQNAAKQKAIDKSLQSLKEVNDELVIHKSITSNQELTITDLNSKIQTLQNDLEHSRLDTARKEELLKKSLLQPSPSTTSSTNKSNDPSNTDNTDKIPASPPQNTSADAPKVTITVPTNTTNGPNGISNSNNTNETPVSSPPDAASADAQDTNASAPLDAASADAHNTIATVSYVLHTTNTSDVLQANPTIDSTSNSIQASTNVTTRPSTIHNEASLLSGLPVTLDNLNLETIKAILSGKNLNPTGRKPDLVNRLRAHLAQHPNPPTPTV